MKKGFTLIELVIVIGILAILAAAVVLVLNPAELLAQARDSQRLSDLGSIKSAVALYLATATTPTLGEEERSTTNATCGLGDGTCTLNASTAVNGTGWVGINLENTTGGAPLSALPLDPSNTATYQYAYDGDNTNKTFEINGRLESQKYRSLMQTDGGDDSACVAVPVWAAEDCYYELGTDPSLNM